MDYVVGGVAALISGNVTPNRPRLIKRALTPTKHPASPNVTPKSEFVEDRSIFLSPTMQKKKAIAKKSPKRIFQNQDLDVTLDGDAVVSPQADKVKKHLKGDLDTSVKLNESAGSQKSPKKKRGKSQTPSKVGNDSLEAETDEPSPKKAKKLSTSMSEDKVSKDISNVGIKTVDSKNDPAAAEVKKGPKKRNRKKKNKAQTKGPVEKMETDTPKNVADKATVNTNNVVPAAKDNATKNKKKRNRKKKNSVSQENNVATEETKKVEQTSIPTKETKNLEPTPEPAAEAPAKKAKKIKNTPQIQEQKPKNKVKNLVNPNAITEKDSESEYESDDNIESDDDEENDEENEENSDVEKEEDDSGDEEDSDSEKEDDVPKPDEDAPESSDDEEEDKKEDKKKEKEDHAPTEEELKRTLFVGNVPFGGKCKKDIKRIFSQYGQIETVRIRSVAMKDSRDTPKLAVIKNELHPDRSTVNVYVKFADADSRDMALAENGTVLNKCHLRVSRADTTGAEHDHRLAVYIGNMPFALEDEALRARFEKCGEIESVRIVRDKKTNVGKGFGYVNFKSKDGVELALALTEEDLTFKNRILRVQRCIQGGGRGAKTPAGGGGRGRGGPGRGGQSSRGHSSDRGGFNRGQSSDRGGFNRGQSSDRGGFNRGQSSDRGGRGHSSDRGGFSRGGGRGFGQVRGRGGQNRGGFGQDGGRGGFRGGRGGFGASRGGGRDFGPPRGRGRGGPGRGAPRGSWGDRSGGGEGGEGAHRRIMHKRKNEEGGGDGPPTKFQRSEQPSQPPREKREKKEFVGMTSEKKKKQKFSKDQKRKKAISEILTK